MPDYSQISEIAFNTSYTADSDLFVWVFNEQLEPGAGGNSQVRFKINNLYCFDTLAYNYNAHFSCAYIRKGATYEIEIQHAGYNANRRVYKFPLTRSGALDGRNYIIKY